jgi:dynein heavy chain 1
MRLQAGIQAWTNALNGTKKEIDLSMDTDAPTQPTHKPGGDPQVGRQLEECGVFIATFV